MSLPRLVESTTLFVLVVLGGCSSDTQDASRAADSSTETRPVDSGESDVVDTGRDSAALDASDLFEADDTIESDGEELGDTGPMLPKHPCRRAAEGVFGDFHVVNSARAVNSYYFSSGREERQTPCGAVALLDVASDGKVESLDTKVYPNSLVVTTVVEDKILTIAVEYEIERKEDGGVRILQQVNSFGDVYEFDGDDLNRLSRTRFLLDEPNGGSKSYPLTLDSNGDQIILVGRQRFVELKLGDDDRLGVQREVARGEEIDSLTERMDPTYKPNAGRQVLTDDGYVIEVEHGVSIWKLPPTDQSDEQSSALVSFAPVPKSIHRLRGPGHWAYEPSVEFVYLSEGDPNVDEPTEQEQHLEIVDVSQRDAPTVAARWHVTQDFSPPIERSFRPPDITVTSDRVYLDDLRVSERRPVLRILDISEDPTVVDEIGEVWDFGLDDPGTFRGARPIKSRMFLNFDHRDDGYSIYAVDRNSLESEIE